MTGLDWKLILYVSLVGPVLGLLMVLGVFPQGIDRVAWALVTVVCTAMIARRAENNAFGTAAVAGFISGASWTLVQGLFAATLVENNTWILESFADMPEGFDIQFFILRLAPFIGVANALIFGMITLLMARSVKKRKEQG